MCDSSSCVRPGEETGGGWHFSRCWRHRHQYSCVCPSFVSPPPLESGPSNTNDSQTGSRTLNLSHFHSSPLSACPLCRSLSLKLWSLLKSIMHHGIGWPEYKSFLLIFFNTYVAVKSRCNADSHLPTHHGPPAASAGHLSAVSHWQAFTGPEDGYNTCGPFTPDENEHSLSESAQICSDTSMNA